MSFKFTSAKAISNSYTACSRNSRHKLYLLLSPGIYTLLLKNFIKQEAAEEVLVKVFVELFNNIDDRYSVDDVERKAYKILSHFLISYK